MVESGHYAEVVMGMSRGLKEADPSLRVLPGVIYPFEKSLKSLNRSHACAQWVRVATTCLGLA